MVQRIREVEEALGTNAPRSVSTGEMMNRINLAKSLVAARPIEVGEVIQADAVDIKSPGRGLQPNSLGALVGRTSRRRLEAGDLYATDLSDEVAEGRDYAFRRPWGLPVRYHDYAELMADSNPDFLEFHFSYKDLDLDLNDVFGNLTSPLPMGFACHSPDLFAGDFLLNLASDDDAHWRRSIRELQRVVDTTRAMRKFFADSQEPVVIASLVGSPPMPTCVRTNSHRSTPESLRVSSRLMTLGFVCALKRCLPSRGHWAGSSTATCLWTHVTQQSSLRHINGDWSSTSHTANYRPISWAWASTKQPHCLRLIQSTCTLSMRPVWMAKAFKLAKAKSTGPCSPYNSMSWRRTPDSFPKSGKDTSTTVKASGPLLSDSRLGCE